MKDLPIHNYETLKHILCHLKNVVANSAVNKMESKNLAIVFGPTLVRAAELLTLVQDTAHQCRIVESLISHVRLDLVIISSILYLHGLKIFNFVLFTSYVVVLEVDFHPVSLQFSDSL